MPLTPDLVGQVAAGSVVVEPAHFASRIFAGAPDVFSTLALGSLVEATSAAWLARHIEPGQMSVGAQVLINHTAATPAGLTVTVETRVAAIEGRQVDFEWTARDPAEQVGRGTHRRVVVDADRFMARLAAKTPG